MQKAVFMSPPPTLPFFKNLNSFHNQISVQIKTAEHSVLHRLIFRDGFLHDESILRKTTQLFQIRKTTYIYETISGN